MRLLEPGLPGRLPEARVEGWDFTARWYREAGSAITLTMLGQSIFPHFIKLLVLKLHNWKKAQGRGLR